MKATTERFLANGAAIFLVAALIFGAAGFSKPPGQSSDTKFYLSLSDGLRESRPGVILTTERATWTVITLPALLVVTRSIAPDHWPYLMVAINVLCLAAAAALLVALVRMVTSSVLAALGAFVFFVAAYDVVIWTRFVLTDMIYTCAALAVFVLVVKGIAGDEPSPRRRLWLGLLLLFCFVTRASGAILIPLALLAEFLAWRMRTKDDSPRARSMRWIALAAVALAAMIARAYFFDDMRRWPTDFLRPILEQYAAREKTGEVVWDRHETFHAPPQSTVDHLSIELDRFARFFQFLSPAYSRMHNFVNVAYYVPLYLLALVGIANGLWSADRRRRLLVEVTLLWIFAAAWLHAVTILDFDWRYRLPLMPQIILLAAYGIEALARRLHRVAPAASPSPA